jgi:hypothetical protein
LAALLAAAPGSDGKAAQVKSSDAEKVICRRVMGMGGSRLGPRVCMSRADWALEAEEQFQAQERERARVGNGRVD